MCVRGCLVCLGVSGRVPRVLLSVCRGVGPERRLARALPPALRLAGRGVGRLSAAGCVADTRGKGPPCVLSRGALLWAGSAGPCSCPPWQMRVQPCPLHAAPGPAGQPGRGVHGAGGHTPRSLPRGTCSLQIQGSTILLQRGQNGGGGNQERSAGSEPGNSPGQRPGRPGSPGTEARVSGLRRCLHPRPGSPCSRAELPCGPRAPTAGWMHVPWQRYSGAACLAIAIATPPFCPFLVLIFLEGKYCPCRTGDALADK